LNESGNIVDQLNGYFSFIGAVQINKKYLDGIKDKVLEISVSKSHNGYVININNMVVKSQNIDKKEFLKVMKYELPDIKPVEKPNISKFKRQYTSIHSTKNIDSALLGWKGWTWNSKKLVWQKACNW